MTGACSTFCSPESADEKVGAVSSARTLSTHSFALSRIKTLCSRSAPKQTKINVHLLHAYRRCWCCR